MGRSDADEMVVVSGPTASLASPRFTAGSAAVVVNPAGEASWTWSGCTTAVVCGPIVLCGSVSGICVDWEWTWLSLERGC